ncbi:MAG TPA: RNA methyltransferase [Candidatus Omnitrophota bacterium]|nr:RNA methyltransferase [Candidatus Omnitrophota bacterium]
MACDKITSAANPRVKHVAQLRDRRQRNEEGLTIVEGMREIARAQEGRVVFKEAYVCRELWGDSKSAGSLIGKLSEQNIPVYETTKTVFEKISYGDRQQGVLAVCKPRTWSFEDLASEKCDLFTVIEGVEKPGNLGAILRTCDGAGVNGMIVCDEKTDMYNPNVIRASLGTVFSVKTVVSSKEDALAFLKSRRVAVCATLPQAKTVYTKANLKNPLAVVLGSEQSGLTDFWVQHADLTVRIPMKGHADSLNVSASAAILLYEAIRQRFQ